MNAVGEWALALAEGPDPGDVSPGVPGFLWTFAVALAFIWLVRSFIKHMRRLNINARRAELAAQDDAAAQAAAAGAPAGADPSAEPEQPVEADSSAPPEPESRKEAPESGKTTD